MKKIEAKIRRTKFKEVKKALIEEGFDNFSYNLTRCMSKDSEKRYYRGVEFESVASERIDFSIYVSTKRVQNVLDIILNTGNSGDAHDSFIGVFDVREVFMIKNVDGKDKLISII